MNAIYIISPIVGGVIGYFTNWLAIKMLFRPLKKLYLGPISIPFTPGLIPKERERIAKTIADSVGENLLNPDFLANEAVSPEKLNILQSYLEQKKLELKESHLTGNDLLMMVFNDQAYINQSITNLARNLSIKFTSAEFVEKHFGLILEQVADNIISFLQDSEITKQEIITDLKAKISDETRTLKELLPDNIVASISKYAEQVGETITNEVLIYLEKPEAELLIRQHIDSYLKKGTFRTMLGMFLDSSMLAQKVIELVRDFAVEPKNKKHLVDILVAKADEIIIKTPQEIIMHLGQEQIEGILLSGVDILLDKKLIRGLISKERLLQLLDSSSSQEFLEEYLLTFFGKIQVVKVQTLYNYLGDKRWQTIEDKAINLYKNKAPNFLKAVFLQFDLAGVIEEKINSFDLIELEEILLNLMAKELKAITWLGGLLGFFMGVLTPLINILFG